jgi:hypothetical protein
MMTADGLYVPAHPPFPPQQQSALWNPYAYYDPAVSNYINTEMSSFVKTTVTKKPSKAVEIRSPTE